MRTMAVVLLMTMGALVWAERPATAGDDDKARIAELEAKVGRLEAESTHLKEAYNQLSVASTRGHKAMRALTGSINASRDVIAALTKQRDQLQGEVKQLRIEIVKRPEDDPARLKLALRDAQTKYGDDVNRLHAQIDKLAWRATVAEAALAVAKQQHADELTTLRAELASAQATIKELRAAK